MTCEQIIGEMQANGSPMVSQSTAAQAKTAADASMSLMEKQNAEAKAFMAQQMAVGIGAGALGMVPGGGIAASAIMAGQQAQAQNFAAKQQADAAPVRAQQKSGDHRRHRRNGPVAPVQSAVRAAHAAHGRQELPGTAGCRCSGPLSGTRTRFHHMRQGAVQKLSPSILVGISRLDVDGHRAGAVRKSWLGWVWRPSRSEALRRPAEPVDDFDADICADIASGPSPAMSLKSCRSMMMMQQRMQAASSDPNAVRPGDENLTCPEIYDEIRASGWPMMSQATIAQNQQAGATAMATLEQQKADTRGYVAGQVAIGVGSVALGMVPGVGGFATQRRCRYGDRRAREGVRRAAGGRDLIDHGAIRPGDRSDRSGNRRRGPDQSALRAPDATRRRQGLSAAYALSAPDCLRDMRRDHVHQLRRQAVIGFEPDLSQTRPDLRQVGRIRSRTR